MSNADRTPEAGPSSAEPPTARHERSAHPSTIEGVVRGLTAFTSLGEARLQSRSALEGPERAPLERAAWEGPWAPAIEARRTAEGCVAVFDVAVAAARWPRAASGRGHDRWPVLPLAEGQQLTITHSNESDSVSAELRGICRASDIAGSRRLAGALWHDLQVALCDPPRPYALRSATPEGPVRHHYSQLADLRPIGLRLQTSDGGRAGFGASKSATRGLVLLPGSFPDPAGALDLVARAALPSSLEVAIALSPLALDERQRALVRSAVRCLERGGEVAYGAESPSRMRDPELANRLLAWLGLWERDPRGLQLLCRARSTHPIPASLLAALASHLYGIQPVSSSDAECGAGDEQPLLDLRCAVHGSTYLPSLLPSCEAMLACGFPVEYPATPLALADRGIVIGRVHCRGRQRIVRLGNEDRKKHCYLVGATGTGKSTLMLNMLAHDIRSGAGVCLLDPHGDLFNAALELPGLKPADVVLVEPGGDRAPGINFLEIEDGVDRQRQSARITNEMLAIFGRLYDLERAGGPCFELYMRNALMLVMENEVAAGTLVDIPLLFESAGYRKRLVDSCTNPYAASFWRDQAESVRGEWSLENLTPYITCKLNQFTHNALLRPIVGQGRSTLSFRRCMDEGKVLLVNLSKGLLGELDSRLLGMLVVGKLLMAAMGRASLSPSERRPFHVYLDEAHSFTTPTTASMLAEARKFGLHLCLASQTLDQLDASRGASVMNAVLGNVGSLLLFRLGAPDASRFATYVEPELQARDLEDLPSFNAAARILVDGKPSRPFVLQTFPAPAPISAEERRKRLGEIAAGQLRYSRPASEVEQVLLRRRTQLSGG